MGMPHHEKFKFYPNSIYNLIKHLIFQKKIATYSVAKRERHQQVDVLGLTYATGPGMFVADKSF
ncbi:hypothetical protein [Acinetobacter sp. YH12126]|uniref:hypothetical protein n=1 Tax=Acinetobacter sp. YH12126 TaxID=2601111 RepID=UPI0015D3B020|nr:hypothetical protein [Acinetobacter sp. YH12126]